MHDGGRSFPDLRGTILYSDRISVILLDVKETRATPFLGFGIETPQKLAKEST